MYILIKNVIWLIYNVRDGCPMAKFAIKPRIVNPIKVKSKYTYKLKCCYLECYKMCGWCKINIYSEQS